MNPFVPYALIALLSTSTVFAQTLPETSNKPYVLQTFASPVSTNIEDNLEKAQATLLNSDGSYHGAWTLQNGLLQSFADELFAQNTPLSSKAREISKDWYMLYRVTPASQTENTANTPLEERKFTLNIDLFTQQGKKVLPKGIQLDNFQLDQESFPLLIQELAKQFPEFRPPVADSIKEAVFTSGQSELSDQAFLKSLQLNPDNHTITWNNQQTHGQLYQINPEYKLLGIFNRDYQWILSPEKAAQMGYHNLHEWYPSMDSSSNSSPFYVFRQADNSNCHGLIDAQGKQILPAQYTYSFQINPTKEQIIAEHCQTQSFVLIDSKTGKHLFEPPLEYAHLRLMSFPDEQGDMLVQSNSDDGVLLGSLNLNGRLTLPVRFSTLTEFNERNEAQAQWNQQNTQGIIQRDGKWAVPPSNQAAQSQVQALPNSDWLEWSSSEYGAPTAYSLRQNPHHFVGDSPFKAQGIELVSGFDKQGYGLARKIDPDPAKMLHQQGFVNPQGQWLIQPQYTSGDEHCGYFDNLNDCAHAVLEAERNSSRALSDEPSYVMHNTNSTKSFVQDLFFAQQNQQRGVINRQGKVIVPFAYQKVSIPQQQKFIIAETENSTHLYNLQGKRLHTFSGSLSPFYE